MRRTRLILEAVASSRRRIGRLQFLAAVAVVATLAVTIEMTVGPGFAADSDPNGVFCTDFNSLSVNGSTPVPFDGVSLNRIQLDFVPGGDPNDIAFTGAPYIGGAGGPTPMPNCQTSQDPLPLLNLNAAGTPVSSGATPVRPAPLSTAPRPNVTGSYDPATNTITIDYCAFELSLGSLGLPDTWSRLITSITINKVGPKSTSTFELRNPVEDTTCADLAGPSPTPTTNSFLIDVSGIYTDQGPPKSGYNSDWDKDGCLDWRELSTNVAQGGLRDPWNKFDYFEPTHDGLNRVGDILKVVTQFFVDDTDSNPGEPPYAAGYDPDTDRTAIGPNAWNLGRPNGLQRVDDILASVKQFFHDCPSSIP